MVTGPNPENTLMIKSKTSYVSHGVSFNKYLLNTCYVRVTAWVLPGGNERTTLQVPSLLECTPSFIGAIKEKNFS